MAARDSVRACSSVPVYTHLHIFYDRIIPIDILHIIAQPIQARLPVNSITGSAVEHNEYVGDCISTSHDHQLNGRELLNILDERWKDRAVAYFHMHYRPPQTARRVVRLLLTPFDCFISGLTFVFGVSRPHSSCFVSLARLCGHAPLIITEVVHELGHVFGLRHCQQRVGDGAPCVMTRSIAVQHAMAKASTFCINCKSIVYQHRITPPLISPMSLDSDLRAALSSYQQDDYARINTQYAVDSADECTHATSESIRTQYSAHINHTLHQHTPLQLLPHVLP